MILVFKSFKMDISLLLITTIFALTLARPSPDDDFIDDEENAEITVPRSPKIQGPQIEYLIFTPGSKLDKLTCEVEGNPMPKVVWLKNGVGVQQLQPPLGVDFNAEESLSALSFPPDSYFNFGGENETMLVGNYTCVAANFLGRASKSFIISLMEAETTTMGSGNTLETTTLMTTLLP